MWSYHAGAGNVYEAMRVYFLDMYNQDIGNYSEAVVSNDAEALKKILDDTRNLMETDKLSFYKLVTNEKVKSKVIANLEDYSETYVPAASAILKHEAENGDQKRDLGNGLRISVPNGTFHR